MIVGILQIDFFIHASCSLKSKRKVLKSIKDKIRAVFNVSVAEVGNHDKWQRSTLGVACLALDKSSANSILDKVLNYLRGRHEIDLGDYEIELL